MATNAIKYIRNVGKSVSYASFDAIKKLNPVFSDFAETNGELATDMYKSIKKLKKNRRDLPRKLMESKYGKFAKTYKDNLFEDLKTGKFYNKERIEKDNSDGGFAGFDDLDFDFGSSDNFDDLDFSNNDEISSTEMMDIVGEKASNAVSNTMARSAEYIVEGIGESNKAIYNQMTNIYGGIHKGLSTINQNISKMLEFSDTVVTHFDNSSTFYTEITRLDQERNEYLKDILENLKKMNDQGSNSLYRNSGGTTYSDIVSYNGAIDFSQYFKNIKKNANNATGSMGDMLSMIMDSGMADTLISSPLQDILTSAIGTIIPGIIKKSMENLNTSLSGLAGSAFLKLKNKARAEGGIWDTISNIFGIDTSLRTKLDPSDYQKGKVPFDGITRKSIVEVIPTYLSKILSAISGQNETRFNYDKGEFVTLDQLQKELNDLTTSGAKRAAYNIDNIVRDKKGSIRFRDKNDEKQFDDDWQALIEYMYKNERILNTRDKKLTGADFGLKGGAASDVNLKRFQKILDGSPEMLRYANEILRERDDQNRRMRSFQNSGTMTALFNGSVPEPETNDKSSYGKSPAFIANINNPYLSELAAIHKELSYIRIYGTGKSKGGKKSKGSQKPNFDNFNIPKSRTGNDSEYDKNNENSVNDLTDDSLNEEVSDMIQDSKKESNNKNKSFSDRINEASGLSAKMSILAQSATELAKKPAKFVVSMLDKADERLYDLIYGPKEDTKGNKSFIGKLFKGLEGLFDSFSKFVTDKILDPLKEKLTGENISNFFKSTFEKIFKKDFDSVFDGLKEKIFGKKDADGNRTKDGIFGRFIDDYKSQMKKAFGWVKGSFKSVGDDLGVTSKKNKSGLEKEARNQERDDLITKMEDIVKKSTSDIDEAASGIKKVNKTGLAVISEGEMVIPPDMNPFNVSKRERNEKRVKDNLKNGIDSIFEFSKGDKNIKISDDQRKHNNATKARIASQKADKLRKEKESFTKEDYERTPFAWRMADTVIDGASMLYDNISSNLGLDEKAKQDFKDKATKFISGVKEHGSTMAAGATIGAGASLLTGLIGGPLVGAAVGAGIGLISKSETVQKMLFGDEEKDGLLPKKLTEGIKKYLPDMGKGGAVGGIIGAMPFIPGGPITGMIVGSTIGFIKNNENLQKALFGENLEKKEAFQKKVQSALPKMGVGALAGLVAGPFGLTTNILLGSALGFASDSEKFKDLIFGKEKDGKRSGGILDAIVNPTKKFFKDMYGEFKDFIKTGILDNIKKFIDPVKRRIKRLGKSLMKKLTDKFKKHIWEPINQFLKDRLFSPIGKLIGGVAKKAFGLVKFLNPFKLLGRIGEGMTLRDISKGTASDLSAQERNEKRESAGYVKKVTSGAIVDKYKDIDQALVKTDAGKLSDIEETLSSLRNANKNITKTENDAYSNIYDAFYQDENLKGKSNKKFSRDALRMIRRGGYEDASKFIQGSDIDEESKANLLNTINKEAERVKKAKALTNNLDQTEEDIRAKVSEMLGVDIDKSMISGLSNGDQKAEDFYEIIRHEAEVRKKEAEEKAKNEEQDKAEKAKNPPTEEDTAKRHEEIKKPLDDINENIKELLNKINELRTAKDDGDKYTGLPSVDGEDDINMNEGHIRNNINAASYNVYQKHNEIMSEAKDTADTLKENIKTKYNDARDSDIGSKLFGKRDGAKNKVPVIVSEGESVVSEVDDIEEKAKGGIAGDGGKKPNNIFGIIRGIYHGISKIASVVLAYGYKEGISTDSVNPEEDSNGFFNKIKNKFGKAKSTVTQFFNGRPMKYVRDKNGDLIPDSSNAENKETMDAIEAESQTQHGILSSISGLTNKVGGFFGQLFANKEKKGGGIFSKVFGFVKSFLSGSGDDGGISLGSILKGVIKTALPAALLALGWSGKLDKIVHVLSGGAFGDRNANKGLTVKDPNDPEKNIEIQTDDDGKPITDENGNYLTINGDTISGDVSVDNTGSLATMSISDRIKYNTVRNTILGQSSLASATAKWTANRVVKGGKKTAGEAVDTVTDSAVSTVKKTAGEAVDTVTDSAVSTVKKTAGEAMKDAVADEAMGSVTTGITKWINAIKKVPMLSKFADKLDDLAKALTEKIQGQLTKLGSKLSAVKDVLGNVAWVLKIATVVVDFTTGWQDASTILKIKKENVTTPQKIVCGLIRTFKNFIPIVGSFIPESLITDLFIDHVAKWFKIDVSAIKKQRDEAQAELDDYNEEHSTNYSWEEYNKKVLGNYTWTEKTSNGIKKVAKGIGKGIKKGTKFVGNRIKTKVNSLKEFIEDPKEAIKNRFDSYKKAFGVIEEKLEPVFKGIKTIGSGLIKSIKNQFKYAWNGDIKKAFSNEDEDKEESGIVNSISKVVNFIPKIILAVPTLLTASLGSIVRFFESVFKGIKTIGSGLITSVKHRFELAWDGDFKGVLTDTSGDTKTGNKLVDTISVVINGIAKTLTIIPALLVAVVGKVKGFIGDTIETIKGWFSGDSDDIEAGSGSGLFGRGNNKLLSSVKKSQELSAKQNTDISNSTFISQVDPKYRNRPFNISSDTQQQTLGDTGCAPAAAAMAINSSTGQNTLSMEQASKNALRYKVKNDGVNASYFNDEFAQHGINAQYIIASDNDTRKREIASRLLNNNKVVLMGKDPSNTSKANSPFGPNPHYVVATGLSNDGKYIYINDPEASAPNIRYNANKVLGSSKLGIAANVAMGSRKIHAKIRKMTGRGTLPGADNAEKVWNFLRSNGFTEESAAGVMGNLQQESSMNPTRRQNNGGPAAGICQWETYNDYSSRWGSMAKYCESKGADWTDLQCQLEYMLTEAPSQFQQYTGKTHTYENGTVTWWPTKMTLDQFKALKDIEKATEIYERVFTRAGKPMMDTRIRYAKEFYNKFTGKHVDTGTVTSTSSSSSSSSSSSDSEESTDFFSKISSVFSDLLKAWGISSDSSDSSSETTDSSSESSTTTVSGNVSSNKEYAKLQKALVQKMYSVKGKLKYSQSNRDLDANGETSGDCSSTVRWAYQKVLGVDPGSYTGAQRESANTYTVKGASTDESKLQLGDLILKKNPGHVEMYAGDGKTIGHGGGQNGEVDGPTVNKLDTSGKYDLVRRWVGFKDNGSGSGLFGRGSTHPNKPLAYSNVLKHISNKEFNSILPVDYDSDEISKNKVSVTQYNNNKLSNVEIKKRSARGSSTEISEEIQINNNKQKTTNNNDKIVLSIQSIIKLLVEIVTNTSKLNNITTLLSEYITTVQSTDGSKDSKEKAVLAKQNLINAIQSGNNSNNDQNAELMRLIEATERIARE